MDQDEYRKDRDEARQKSLEDMRKKEQEKLERLTANMPAGFKVVGAVGQKPKVIDIDEVI